MALGAGALTLACQLVPGLTPPPTAPRPIEPEPTQCGPENAPRVTPSDPRRPIVGAADFHNHQFADLGFGGRVLWGKSYDERGIAHALSACGADEFCADERETAVCSLSCALAGDPRTCRDGCRGARCASSPPHGHLGLTDPIGMALGQGIGHHVHGYPDFWGWPHYNSYTHQQEYYTWLRRAFEGGLKLIVMLAVTNETLCRVLGSEHACDDMTNVDLQLQAAKNFERFVDWQVDCEEDNDNGWYRIAESPEHARRIIADGALAVVLGIEVDTPFGCRERGGCTETELRRQVAWYRERGVRHVFPVHLMNNGFGGTAAANDFFNFGNVAVNHELLEVRDCVSDGYDFRFGQASMAVNHAISSMAERLGVHYPAYPAMGAHCNERGLDRKLGRAGLEAMMDAGMLIDVDHMSTRTRRDTLALAKACRYPGVVSGHSGFMALKQGGARAEGELSESELNALLEQGGLVAPILSQGHRDENQTVPRQGTQVENDCGDSAKTFAQAYLYAADQLRRQGREFVGVGFGSDMNGFAGLPAPRFGPYACGHDGSEQAGKVVYPFEPLHGSVAQMGMMQAGTRVFDINVDGFANMGMFPDFVAELRKIGLSDDDLAPLFNSAEAYIRLWESAEATELGCPSAPVMAGAN